VPNHGLSRVIEPVRLAFTLSFLFSSGLLHWLHSNGGVQMAGLHEKKNHVETFRTPAIHSLRVAMDKGLAPFPGE
jgi:hypothetical protein